MANIIEKLKRIRPVYRRGSIKTKVILLVLLVLGIAGLFVLHNAIDRAEAANAALETQAAQLVEENSELQQGIDNLDTVQGVEQIARDELGLEDPDTVLIQPTE